MYHRQRILNTRNFCLLLIPILLLAPDLAWAVDPGNPLNFTPPPTDLSIYFLSSIFGIVDGVLAGSGSQIMGAMFKVFNAAVLSLGGIILIYTLLVSTLNTANEGEVLGKKWSSIWIPIRSAAGVALLLPKASGYCLMQIFIMWVVVQGVGAADKIWSAALNYLEQGGVIIQSSAKAQSVTGGSAQHVAEQTGKLLESLVCLHGLQETLEQQRKQNIDTGVCKNNDTAWYCKAVPNFTAGISITGAPEPGSISATYVGCKKASTGYQCIPFPNFSPTRYPFFSRFNEMCGTLSWKHMSKKEVKELAEQADAARLAGIEQKVRTGQLPASALAANRRKLSDAEITNLVTQANQARKIAVQQIFLNMNSVARLMTTNQMISNSPFPYGRAASEGTRWIGKDGKPPLTNGRELLGAVYAYDGLMAPALNRISQDISDRTGFIEQAKSEGWVMAGSYYYELSQLNMGMKDLTDDARPVLAATPKTVKGFFTTNFPDYTKWMSESRLGELQTLINGKGPKFQNSVPDYAADAKIMQLPNRVGEGPPKFNPIWRFDIKDVKGLEATTIRGGFMNIPGFVGTILMRILVFIVNPLIQLFNSLLPPLLQSLMPMVVGMVPVFKQAVIDAAGGNPILVMAIMGNEFISIGVSFWIASAILSTVIMAIPAVGIGVTAFLMLFLAPLVALLVSTLFTTGITMAYYVPLIPYLVFTYASIGWLIGVIEAMVAAPLVALGVMHPEGKSEHFGNADQAIMLLLNVFLRPSMMVIGLFAGIILAQVGCWVLNTGYSRATNIFSFAANSWSAFIASIFFIVIYVSVYVSIVTKSFEMIHILPDKILRWLSGGMQESLGQETAGMAKDIGGKVDSAGGQMAQAGKQGHSDAVGAKKEAASIKAQAKSGGQGDKEGENKNKDGADPQNAGNSQPNSPNGDGTQGVGGGEGDGKGGGKGGGGSVSGQGDAGNGKDDK